MKRWLLSLVWLGSVASAAVPGAPDPYYGDWQGTITGPAGEQPLYGQVIALGKGQYQANLLPALNQRVAPVAVLQGQLDGETVKFGDAASLTVDRFTGTLAEPARRFTMTPVQHLSPTLGARPPAGAVVLIGGGDLSAWKLQPAGRPYVADLTRIMGGNDAVAYLKTTITSPAAQDAELQVGSDDGFKAWLNGEEVLSANVLRPLTEWQDKGPVKLRAGANELLLKVTQNVGGAQACARFVTPGGESLAGLTFDPAPKLPDGASLADVQGGSAGTVVTWLVSPAYKQDGQGAAELFAVPFAPEPGQAGEVKWQKLNEQPQVSRPWDQLDGGEVEVTPRSGSMNTAQSFKDFTLHVEFRTPFMPDARGQGRGNSGVYLQNRHEVQVLDSYGLAGEPNECGGLYKHTAPAVNACSPPLQWQTYDIDFTAARYDAGQQAMVPARVTVRHNGVLIHDDVALPLLERGGPGFVAEGPILLQDHNNPVRYRNVWIVAR